MDLYGTVSMELARLLTRRYSSSFSAASKLFPSEIEAQIYNIYALVRIADEIVDSYHGPDQAALLDDLEQECLEAAQRGYSANPVVHAFILTAKHYDIGTDLTAPFFASMRLDLAPQIYTRALYETYIYGSAEVVGLMCLKVFCAGNPADYNRLAPGAQRLGAAYQKVNFLRDLAADQTELNRYYFPGSSFETFNDDVKLHITQEIATDFAAALPYIKALPRAVQPAVMTSYRYYKTLLDKLEQASAETIKTRRLSVPAYQKMLILAPQTLKSRAARRARRHA